MASSDVDQKFLAAAAKRTAPDNALASAAFYKILGNSVLLARKLYRARKLRKLDTSRDTKSLSLYQHIIWMSREGLELLDTFILPDVMDGQFDAEVRVLAVKLRASYHHIFCLFHNQPPVSQAGNPYYKPTSGSPKASPRSGPTKRNGKSSNSPAKTRGGLREPIDSITSETSFVTNPYHGSTTRLDRQTPPGLAPPPGLSPVRIPQPSAFLLPVMNWLPLTSSYFVSASAYAQASLPGSHPLRLSVALEHAAFLWDCLHDHDGARSMARAAIKDVYRAPESMEDEDFHAAAELVATLGRMMKRRSWEGTPRPGTSSSPTGNPPPLPTQALPPQSQTSPKTPRQQSRAEPPQPTSSERRRRQSTSSRDRSVSFAPPTGLATLAEPSEPTDTRPTTRRGPAATAKEEPSSQRPAGHHNRRPQKGGGGASAESTPRADVVNVNRASYGSAGSVTPRANLGSHMNPGGAAQSGAVQPASPRSTRRGADSPGRGALGRGGGRVVGR